MPVIANLAPNLACDVIDRPRPQLQYGVGGTLQLAAFLDSTQIVPSPATITVLRFGGSPCSTPVTTAACSVDGNGTMSYVLSAGNANILPPYGEGYAPWTANWFFTSGGVAYQKITTFDVVQWPIYNVVRTSDLANHYPDITSTLFTAESSTQSYISEAFIEVRQRLDNNGNRPWLVIDSEQVRKPVEYLALSKFFEARAKDNTGKDFLRFQRNQKRFDDWFTTTKFVYNYEQTGYITANDVNRPINQTYTRT